jgi:hypothetical protein
MTSIESPLFFVHDVARVKSIRIERDVDREPLAFVRVGSLTVRAFGSKPLALIGDTLIIGQSHTEHHYAQKCLSPSAVPRVTL